MTGGGRFRRPSVLGAMVLGVFWLVACSGSSATPATGRGTGANGAPVPPAATAGPAAAPTSRPGGSGSVPGDVTAGQLIVRTGTLEVEVTDVELAVAHGRDLVTGVGGYVSASDEAVLGDQHRATITYRIPVDRWQEAITGLRAIGSRVIKENTQADEVTSQVVDLEARIQNLRASETSIREIMTRAGTIDDVLNVQTRLQSVQEDIERLVAQQQDLSGRAALGTLAVSWESPVAAAVAEVQSGWNLGHEVDHALAQTVAVGQGLASFLVWLLIVGVPVLGPLVLVVLFVLWYLRRYQRLHPRAVFAGWDRVGTGPAGWYPSPGSPPGSGDSGPGAAPHDHVADDSGRDEPGGAPPAN